GHPQTLATSSHRASARRLCHAELAVVTDAALQPVALAALGRDTGAAAGPAPTHLFGTGGGDCADRPRRLGQLQLRGPRLCGLPPLSQRVVAGHGFYARL